MSTLRHRLGSVSPSPEDCCSTSWPQETTPPATRPWSNTSASVRRSSTSQVRRAEPTRRLRSGRTGAPPDWPRRKGVPPSPIWSRDTGPPSDAPCARSVLNGWHSMVTGCWARRVRQTVRRGSGAATRGDHAQLLNAARSVVQVSEDGEHAPVVVFRRWQREPIEDRGGVLADRLLRDEQPGGDRRVRAALGHQREHLTLASGEHRHRVVGG